LSLKEQFSILTEFFDKEKYDYALVGALALHAYGYTRATKDIDFITRDKYQKKIIKYLESLGFKTLHSSAGFSNHFNPVGSMRIDLIYVEDYTADSIFKSVRDISVFDNKKCPVIDHNHLIILKLFALKNDPDRKYKELADIKELLKLVTVDKEIRPFFELPVPLKHPVKRSLWRSFPIKYNWKYHSIFR